MDLAINKPPIVGESADIAAARVKALYSICMSCREDTYSKIAASSNSREAWNLLAVTYQSANNASRLIRGWLRRSLLAPNWRHIGWTSWRSSRHPVRWISGAHDQHPSTKFILMCIKINLALTYSPSLQIRVHDSHKLKLVQSFELPQVAFFATTSQLFRCMHRTSMALQPTTIHMRAALIMSSTTSTMLAKPVHVLLKLWTPHAPMSRVGNRKCQTRSDLPNALTSLTCNNISFKSCNHWTSTR